MRLAEKSYAAGDMLSALRFLHALVAEADDADVETYLRIADVYENTSKPHCVAAPPA